MKKVIFPLLFFVLVSTALFAEIPFQLFVMGNPIRIHPLVFQNKIYLPLEEIAPLFHLKADVDLASRQVFLEPEKEPEASANPPQTFPLEAVLFGKVFMRLNETSERPLLRAKIKLFKANANYDEETNRRAIEQWVLKNDSFYLDTHGVVSETKSDISGRFAFSKIPAGSYELVAFYAVSPTDLRYWWVPLRIIPKESQAIELSLQSSTRILVKGHFP